MSKSINKMTTFIVDNNKGYLRDKCCDTAILRHKMRYCSRRSLISAVGRLVNRDETLFVKVDSELIYSLGALLELSKRYRIKFATEICANDDVVKLMLFMVNFNSDYQFYLRHYTDSFDGTVLYVM